MGLLRPKAGAIDARYLLYAFLGEEFQNTLVVKITAKQDRLELPEGPDGFLLRPQRIDFASLAPLRDTIRRHRGPFDLEEFRNQRHDPALRD